MTKPRVTMLTILMLLSSMWLCSAALADTPARSQPAEVDASALRQQAQFVQAAIEAHMGQAQDLHIGGVSQSYYPLSDQTLYHAKVTNVRTHQTMTLSLDATGEVIDGRAALEREEQARREKYGKLEPELYELLRAQPDGSSSQTSVAIWLPMLLPPADAETPLWMQRVEASSSLPKQGKPLQPPAADRIERLKYETQQKQFASEVDAALQAESLRVRAAIAQRLSPLVGYLRTRGWSIDYVSQDVPAVYATLSKAAILELQDRDEVQSIGLVRRADNCMDVAKLAIDAHYAWDEGYSGLGVKVGVIEVGGRAAVENPYLRGVIQDAENAPAETQSHATATTGMIRGRHSDYRGISYGALVRVGGATGGDINQLRSAAERALTWGANILSNSWGTFAYNYETAGQEQMDDEERYWDSLALLQRRTIVFAAGNEGTEHGYLRHPGYAYNLISVGAYDDHNTESWSDDSMADFSSYKDCQSANGDREKPELCAPGVNIYATTTRSPWVGNCGNGTSYACPITSGSVALLMQAVPELRAWPEAVKAILMASAWDNIELGWWMEGRDGAGGIDAYEALYTAQWHHWAAAELTRANFDANGYAVLPIDVPTAAKIRAVVVWSVDPGYSRYLLEPQIDVDLDYRLADGTVFDRSESADNNFEVVAALDVTAGRRYLGFHIARVDNPNARFRLAWAWDYRSQ